jgi:hypothetical protein
MGAKEKLLVLWLFVVVIVAILMTHFFHHVLLAFENCFAFVLAGLIHWS